MERYTDKEIESFLKSFSTGIYLLRDLRKKSHVYSLEHISKEMLHNILYTQKVGLVDIEQLDFVDEDLMEVTITDTGISLLDQIDDYLQRRREYS